MEAAIKTRTPLIIYESIPTTAGKMCPEVENYIISVEKLDSVIGVMKDGPRILINFRRYQQMAEYSMCVPPARLQ